MGPRQQAVAANLSVALSTLDSVIVVTGPAGVGKTTLTTAALRMTHTRLALGWLPSTPTNGAELLEALLAEFGFNAHRIGRVERLQMWRQFLNEMNATDTRVFVIAEHADAMEVEVLRALESVTAADPNGCPGANVVLLGQAELTERLQAPALASLEQRVRLRQVLEPFSPTELEAYLKRRVAAANGTFDVVFEPEAVARLHRYTNGSPRAVNNLCETALTLAATTGAQRVTAELVTKVAVDLLGMDGEAGVTAHDAPAAPSLAAPMAGAARQHEQRTADEFPVLTDAVEAPAPVAKCAAVSPAVPAPAAPQMDAAEPPTRVAAAPAVVVPQAPAPYAAQLAPIADRASNLPAADTRPAAPSPFAAYVAPPKPTSVATPPVPPAPSKPVFVAALPPRNSAATAPATVPAPVPAPLDDDDQARQTQTLRALATAKSIDDISNSMAETLFGEADLDMLSAALASAGWSDDDESEDLLDHLARTSVEDSATMETPKGAFASFGHDREAALSLLDDATVPDAGAAPKAAAKR
jgi:type II secretory pathway predicted ATPase ExeA